MQRLIGLFIIIWGITGYGQDLNFRQVDTTTWKQYIEEDWSGLINIGEEAIEQGIDYYYLEMRMAYAWFSLKKYRKAIPYYKKALEYNSRDHTANEFLYYSYNNSGRENDAIIRERYLSDAQKKAMKISNNKLSSIALSHSYGFTNTDSIQEKTLSGITFFRNGVQKATFQLHSTQLAVAHQIGKRFSLKHKLSYISKNELSYVIADNTEYLSPEQNIKQFEYSLNADYSIVEGSTISPGIHVVRTLIPIYAEEDYGTDVDPDRSIVYELAINNLAYKIKYSHEFSLLTAGLSAVYYDFNSINTIQVGAHLTYYPFANLNLYLRTDHFFLMNNYQEEKKNNYVFMGVLGGKIIPNLWMEANISLSEYMNLYNVNYDLASNDLQLQGRNIGFTAIVPLYKANLKIFAGYYMQSSVSGFFPDDDLFNPVNRQSYTNQYFKLGTKWIL